MPSSAYHTRGLWHTSVESSPTARACGTPSQMRLQKQKASTPLRNGSPTSCPMLRSLPQHPVNSHFYTYMHLFPGVVDTFSHTHTVRDTLIGSCTISEEEELTAPAISRPWLKPNESYRGGDYRIFSYISRGIYPRTKYYTDNSSYTRVTPSGKKLYRKQVEFSKCERNMTRLW